MKRVDPIDTLRVVLRTGDSFTIVDICLAVRTGEARLACAVIEHTVTIENRMTFACVV